MGGDVGGGEGVVVFDVGEVLEKVDVELGVVEFVVGDGLEVGLDLGFDYG